MSPLQNLQFQPRDFSLFFWTTWALHISHCLLKQCYMSVTRTWFISLSFRTVYLETKHTCSSSFWTTSYTNSQCEDVWNKHVLSGSRIKTIWMYSIPFKKKKKKKGKHWRTVEFFSWTFGPSSHVFFRDVFQSVSRTCVQSCSLGKQSELGHKHLRHSRNPAVVIAGLVGTDLKKKMREKMTWILNSEKGEHKTRLTFISVIENLFVIYCHQSVLQSVTDYWNGLMYLLVKNAKKKKKKKRRKSKHTSKKHKYCLALDTVMRCCIYKAICFLIVGLRLDFFSFLVLYFLPSTL